VPAPLARGQRQRVPGRLARSGGIEIDPGIGREADDEIPLLALQPGEQRGPGKAAVGHEHPAQRRGEQAEDQLDQLLLDAILAGECARDRRGRTARLAAGLGPELGRRKAGPQRAAVIGCEGDGQRAGPTGHRGD
jgi:hypothetical protein